MVVNKYIEKIGKKNLILIGSFTLVLLLAILGGTLAFFVWQGEESSIDVSVSSGTGSCTLISDNKQDLIPTKDKLNGRIIKLRANQSLATVARIIWNIRVNTLGTLKHNTFKYELVNDTTGQSYGTGNFGSVNAPSTIPLSNSELLNSGTNYDFTLYLWIDGNEVNPSTMADTNFDFDINCNITGAAGTQ